MSVKFVWLLARVTKKYFRKKCMIKAIPDADGELKNKMKNQIIAKKTYIRKEITLRKEHVFRERVYFTCLSTHHKHVVHRGILFRLFWRQQLFHSCLIAVRFYSGVLGTFFSNSSPYLSLQSKIIPAKNYIVKEENSSFYSDGHENSSVYLTWSTPNSNLISVT